MQFQITKIMTTTKTKKQNEKTAREEKQKPKKLSKAGQWFRAHPHGLGAIINDRRILYGLSPFDPDYHLPPQ